MLKGIDISHYQSGFGDFSKLKSDGYDFIIAKLTEGVTYRDSSFSTFYVQAADNDIPMGAYVFSHAENVDRAVAEATHALQTLANRPLALPVFLDMEKDSIAYLGKKTLTEVALAFCGVIKANGYKAGVYANRNWFLNYLDADAIRNAGFTIWCAAYSNNGAGIECDIWQNSDRGRISNYSGNVDTDVLYNEALLTGNSSEIPNNSPEVVISEKETTTYDLPVIYKGSTGVYVTVAQLLLNAKGYKCGNADGAFGKNTEAALSAFQRANGLTADGIAGAATWPVLLSKKS